MNEQSDTPRETCETCYGLGRVDAVYAPCPDCELTAARAEIEWLKLKLTAARAEIDMLGIRYAAAEMHHANNMQEVTERRDRLAEALKPFIDVWSDKYCDLVVTISQLNFANEALQSLTTNETK
jgi:hypothetical protein